MHGAGNDFVVVDGRGMDRDWASLAAAMSDRHFGVGSDGLLLVLPSDVADARMRMWNPDGSEAEMCGNGIRCFTKFAVERGLVTPRDGRFLAETHIGVLEVEPIMRDGKVVRARVNQGQAGPDAGAGARRPVAAARANRRGTCHGAVGQRR